MIRSLAASLLVCLLAVPAFAQNIPVRSGEHGNFTRLALDIPADLVWRLEQVDAERVTLHFERDGLRFDTSAVFDRIDQSRIRALTPSAAGDALQIDLSCRCVADAFTLQGRMLVLDILPGTFTPTPQTVEAAAEELAKRRGETAGLFDIRVGQNPGIGPDPSGSPLLPSFMPTQREALTAPAPEPDLEPGRFEQMLAEQLATAATDGLLKPAVRDLPKAAPIPDGHAPPTGIHEDPSSGAHLPGSIEVALAGRDPDDLQAHVRIGGIACISASDLDVASWGSETTFDELIPELRSRLYGEFDRLDEEIMLAMARAYINIGFGAEARALLDLAQGRNEPVLMALAAIVDGRADRTGVFAGQTSCDGPAALWAVAGSTTLPESAQIDANAVLRAFEELPLQLRELLGPNLATRLAEEGLPDAARGVISRLARATGDHSDDMRFSEARISQLEGAVEDAQALLGEIAARPGPNAAEAVAASIEIATEHGSPIGTRMTDLSAAYSTELRDTDRGPDLWLANIRALAANAQYEEAFTALQENPEYPEETRAKAVTDALEILTDHAADPSFLKQTVGDPGRFDGLAKPAVALAVSGRLLEIGLPDAARTWLEFEGIDRAARDTRLLNARIHLARGEPEEAEIGLIGLQGEDVLRLRAEARRMMGDFEYARNAFETLGETSRAESAAWLAGDWAALEAQGGTLGAAAALADSSPLDLGGPPSLAIAESLAGSAEETRSTLRALLDETRLPEP